MKSNHKLSKILLTLTLLMDMTASLASENFDDLGLSLGELFNIKIIGSTLREESLNTVPSSVTVFKGEEIRRMGITDMESLMNYVPSFQSYRLDNSGTTYSYSARGRRTGIFGREVLVLVDGQRMTNDWASGSLLATPLLDMENVERVEFIRGPGSALYGSNAFLGVVNIITDKSLNNVEVAVNSFDGKQGHVNYSYTGEELEAAIFVKYIQDRGEKYHDVYDTTNKRSSDTRDPRNGFNLNFSTEYKGWNFNLSHIQSQNKQFYQLGNFSNDFNKSQHENSYINLSYAWNWLGQVDSVFKIGYRHLRQRVYMSLLPAGGLTAISIPSGSEPLFISVSIEEQEPVIKFHNAWHITNNHDLQFGIEYRRPELIDALASNNYDMRDLSNGNFPIRYYGELLPTTPVGKKRARGVIGLYGQYQFSPWKPLSVTAGVRYDRYDDFGSSVNPRLALVYQAREKTALKLLYGEAFRAPSFSETDIINNPIVIGNPDLKPEKSKTWELILVQQFERFNFALTYFDVLMTDSIGAIQTDSSYRTYANGGEEQSRGFEFEISAELTNNMLLRGTFSHFTATPERAFRESTDMASLIFNYHIDKWNFNISGNWQGDKQFQYKSANGLELRDLNSFAVVNTKLQYELDFDTTLFVQVDNLFDNDYLSPPQETKLPHGVPNRGRGFWMGINWKF